MYQHVKVPGFGCTYPHDYSDTSRRAAFKLMRLVKGELEKVRVLEPSFLFVIEAGAAEIVLVDTTRQMDFEAYTFVPAGTEVTIKATTPIVKLVLIGLKQPVVKQTIEEFSLPAKRLAKMMSSWEQLPRTTWVNEVCHRYSFERSVAQAPESLAAAFLERELLKEFFYANRSSERTAHDAPYFVELPDPLKNVLQHIERNLHKNMTLDDLARVAVASKPTLVRLFRKHLHTSPVKYFWTRRLEEADRLLLTGRFQVAEVAEITGFSDSSSFSEAYKSHFHTSPSRRKP